MKNLESNPSSVLWGFKYCGVRFLIALTTGIVGGYLAIGLLGLRPPALFAVSTTGVRHVAIPAIERAATFGVDPAVIVFLANSIAAVVFTTFLLTATLFDPERIDRFPSLLRRMSVKDPTIKIFSPIRTFRKIGDERLRPLYVALVVGPMAGVIALGVLIGLIVASYSELAGGGPISTLVTFGFLLPHGLFEIPALLISAALPISAFLALKEDIFAGDVGKVFAGLRARARFRSIRNYLGLTLIMLAAAAVIETHLTDSIGRLIEELLR